MSMPLLLDDALRAKRFHSINPHKLGPLEAEAEELRADLPRCVPFEVSNVADYYYLGREEDPEEADILDVPGLIPPFDFSWFEWRLPGLCRDRGQLLPLASDLGISREGVLVKILPGPAESPSIHLRILNLVEGLESGALYIGGDDEALVDKQDGRELWEEGWGDGKRWTGYVLGNTVRLAMSFMNCRNVKTREIRNSRQLLRQAERKHEMITQSYRVIEIQPFKQELTAATGKAGYSRQAAAIIRGHFKDYTTGAGLFGAIKGRFWWHQRINQPVARDRHYELRKAAGPLDPAWIEK